MLNIGSHLSTSKGYAHMGREAVSIGANTFQFFTRNPRGGAAKAINEQDIAMSGKGSEIGRSFEELRQIIDGVILSDKLGVCLDTCHVYDAGYDIVNDLDGVLEQFDEIVGLDRLLAIHLNDSKNPFKSHKDRHEKIGQGSLGMETFVRIINHEKLRHLPFYLETPNEVPGYAEEICMLKAAYQG